MQKMGVLVSVLLAACSSIPAEPFVERDASTDVVEDRGRDAGVVVTPRDASVVDAAPLEDAGPLAPECNGSLHASDCAALHLPSAYGVESTCESFPYLGTMRRPKGLAGCVDWETLATGERLTCCPE
jgi:hypothetical protein